ncbi:unnamed protein product [Candida verbasci]|uniref:Uncharacterized protein n=1 Tax=Candida verbasci TaxID=1227364 RepID=A0A9W4XHW4_9ASCO|nr:unnamed protein product [Candida verbasci]
MSNSQFLSKLKTELKSDLVKDEVKNGLFRDIQNGSIDSHDESISPMKPYEKSVFYTMRKELKDINKDIKDRPIKVTSKKEKKPVEIEVNQDEIIEDEDNFTPTKSQHRDINYSIIKDLRAQLKREKDEYIENVKEFRKREKYLIDDKENFIKQVNNERNSNKEKIENLTIENKKLYLEEEKLRNENEKLRTDNNLQRNMNEKLNHEIEKLRDQLEKAMKVNINHINALKYNDDDKYKSNQHEREQEVVLNNDNFIEDSDEDGLIVDTIVNKEHDYFVNDEALHKIDMELVKDLNTEDLLPRDVDEQLHELKLQKTAEILGNLFNT